VYNLLLILIFGFVPLSGGLGEKRKILMPEPIRGIHHITAIASDPQRNLDFYTQVLGLRLIKLTVNFDDPGTYHFYFGDAVGHPGTILTFFPWGNIRRGRHATGQVGMVAFNIPQNSTGFWVDRLKQQGVTVSAPFRRFDEEVLTLLDPDGLPLELIASDQAAADSTPWASNEVPGEKAIRGFSPPTLLLEGFEQTANLLTSVFGMRPVQQSGARYRFTAGNGDPTGAVGGQVDVEVRPNEPPGGMGAGVVHHIAWRAQNDADQLAWREILVEHGLDVTPVLDRDYFHSIYFREPGGILFEIATDLPGFTIDEPADALGSQLKLPAWYEPRRAEIVSALPPLRLPKQAKLPETQKNHAR
jgi:glyoxalase family protein